MRLYGLLAAMMLLSAARDGRADGSDGQYAVYGGGTCWDYIVWVQTKNAAEVQKAEAWIGGYITAYNRQTPDTLSILGDGDLKVAMRWVSKWCEANPKSSMGAAMLALTHDFHPRRYRTAKEARK
jgi:hypothetical protein